MAAVYCVEVFQDNNNASSENFVNVVDSAMMLILVCLMCDKIRFDAFNSATYLGLL